MVDATVIPATRLLSRAELAAAGFLARYTGNTLDAYRLDLRLLFEWCAQHGAA